MEILNIRTILFTSLITTVLTCLLMAGLWWQNRKRVSGPGFWALAPMLSGSGYILIALRGTVPDWLSILAANSLILFSGMLIYNGLERFFHRRPTLTTHAAILVCFVLTHAWFTYAQPSAHIRILNLSFWTLVIAFRSFRFLARDISPAEQLSARFAAQMFLLVTLANAAALLVAPGDDTTRNDIFRMGTAAAALLLAQLVLRVLVSYALLLMVNARQSSKLAEERRKFESAFRVSPHAMLLTRLSDGMIMDVNEGFSRMLGYSRDQAVGQSSLALSLWRNRADRMTAVQELVANRRVDDREFEFITSSRKILVGAYASRIVDMDGQSYAVSCVQDITARKAIESELEAYRGDLESKVEERTVALLVAKEAAEAASRAKSAFLATVSHELRTPLNAVVGMTQMAQLDATDPVLKQDLAIAFAASAKLLGIINNILDISALEAKRLTMDEARFTLRGVFDAAIRMLDPDARAKGLVLSVSVDEALFDTVLIGDPARLGQVVLNLAENAIKFTDRGEIRIRVAIIEEAEAAVVLCFEIADTGCGIAAPDQLRLFEPFGQLDDSITRKQGGSGLGLAIVKRLVEMMDGTVEVESTLGLGSTFRFNARFSRVPGGCNAQAPTYLPSQTDRRRTNPGARLRAHGSRFLVIEDRTFSRMAAHPVLQAMGLNADLATSATQSIEMVRASAYDLILIDQQLPDMHGADLARAIRGLPNEERVPILALVSDEFAFDWHRCQEAGITDHVGKPVQEIELQAALNKWMPERRSQSV